VKKTLIKKDSIDAIIKEANEIIGKNMLLGDKKGWRNKLSATQEEPGATATALGLWFCRETRSEIKIEQSAGKGTSTIEISSYYEELINTVLSMQLADESSDNKLGWALHEHPTISSVDVTATVIKALNHWSLTHIKPEIIVSLQSAAEWLLEQNTESSGKGGTDENRGWGINKNDSDRVFVTCNVLQAILLLNLKLDKNAEDRIKRATKWLLEVKNEEIADEENNTKLWSWGRKRVQQTAEDKPTLYHTAKVLNFLSIYIDWSSDSDRSVIDAYENGINYIRAQIKDGNFSDRNDFVVNEICQAARGTGDNDKHYEHDGFAELVELMMDPRGKWKMHEKCEVLDSFLKIFKDCSESGLEYWEKKIKNSKETRMWLLVPMAKALYDLRECGLPYFDRELIVSPKIVLVDPSRMTKIWFGGYSVLKSVFKGIIKVCWMIFAVFAAVATIYAFLKGGIVYYILGGVGWIVALVCGVLALYTFFKDRRSKGGGHSSE